VIQRVRAQGHRVAIEREKNPEACSSQALRKSACAAEEIDGRWLMTLISATDLLTAICRAEVPDFTGIARRIGSTADPLAVSGEISQERLSEARRNQLL
jgi:hypothetical protein